jgi:cell division protein FtsB
MAKKSNQWVVIYRLAWGVLLVLFVIGLICVFLPRYEHFRALQRRKAELVDNNRTTRAAAQQLKENQVKFQTDPAFVERTAREAGMVKPGEKVFKFSGDENDYQP